MFLVPKITFFVGGHSWGLRGQLATHNVPYLSLSISTGLEFFFYFELCGYITLAFDSSCKHTCQNTPTSMKSATTRSVVPAEKSVSFVRCLILHSNGFQSLNVGKKNSQNLKSFSLKALKPVKRRLSIQSF